MMKRLFALLPAVLLCVGAEAVQDAGVRPGPVVGGQSWRTVPTAPYPGKRDDIIFVNQRRGFYGTGKGDLYRTDDGGRSWHQAWTHAGTFIRSINFVDERTGFLGNLGLGLAGTTDPVPLYRTDDGGESWQPAGLSGDDIAGVCAIDVLRAKAIIAGSVVDRVVVHVAGRANGPAKVARTEDGGAHWRTIDLSDKAGMILDVKFVTPNTGFVFAGTAADPTISQALVLRTDDAGAHWRTVYRSKRIGEVIWKASFASPAIAYATVQSAIKERARQLVLKTVDGGSTWRELALTQDGGATEFGIGFSSATLGWVGTAVGGFETRDGGIHWRRSELARNANKIRTRTVAGEPMIYAIGSEVQLAQASQRSSATRSRTGPRGKARAQRDARTTVSLPAHLARVEHFGLLDSSFGDLK